MSAILDHVAGLKHVAATSGGELAGPCPWCGGEDRFRYWPNHPTRATGGRFLCRGCGRQGDGLQFLMDLDGLTYVEACKRLGAVLKSKRTGPGKPATWKPKASSLPGETWRAAARVFLCSCGPGGEYAQARGLSPETVAALWIGWNPRDQYQPREFWSLPPETNPRTGKPRKVWLPRGLVVPTVRYGEIVAVKIRRADWKEVDQLPKYAAVAGSASGPLVLGAAPGKPVVIVESELDAILSHQEAGDLVAAMAMRTAKGKPDAEAHTLLQAAPLILVALDRDKAGADGWPWWRDHYPRAERCPVDEGKDPGDLLGTPGGIREWIEIGLTMFAPHAPAAPVPMPSGRGAACPYSPEQLAAFERGHPALVCCPRTHPAWNWRNRCACATCATPCPEATRPPSVAGHVAA